METVTAIIEQSDSGNKAKTLKETIGLPTEIKTTLKDKDGSFIAERNINSFENCSRAPETSRNSSNPIKNI